jgi:hypothetical protein
MSFFAHDALLRFSKRLFNEPPAASSGVSQRTKILDAASGWEFNPSLLRLKFGFDFLSFFFYSLWACGIAMIEMERVRPVFRDLMPQNVAKLATLSQ